MIITSIYCLIAIAITQQDISEEQKYISLNFNIHRNSIYSQYLPCIKWGKFHQCCFQDLDRTTVQTKTLGFFTADNTEMCSLHFIYFNEDNDLGNYTVLFTVWTRKVGHA